MLGGLRFVLALCVVFAHIAAMPSHLHTGIYAVFGFYVLSGYLVTGILNGTYRNRPIDFAVNRALKIFPAYCIVALVTVPALLLLPGAGTYHQAWAPSPAAYDIFANAFIFPLAWAKWSDFRLVPPAWSVGVELINYCLIFAFMGRHWQIAAATLLLSLAYHVGALVAHDDWMVRYSPVQAAALPFSLGALIFFSRPLTNDLTAKWLACVGAVVWLANLLAMDTSTPAGQTTTYGLGFYINLFSISVVIAGLATLPRNRIDDYLGDLSYPVFLLHWLVGFLLVANLGLKQSNGLLPLAVSILPILVASILLSRVLQLTVNPLRSRVRMGLTLSDPPICTVARNGDVIGAAARDN
jgi:peptidoglycan/LPS O-acetylase OafA/YrhL